MVYCDNCKQLHLNCVVVYSVAWVQNKHKAELRQRIHPGKLVGRIKYTSEDIFLSGSFLHHTSNMYVDEVKSQKVMRLNHTATTDYLLLVPDNKVILSINDDVRKVHNNQNKTRHTFCSKCFSLVNKSWFLYHNVFDTTNGGIHTRFCYDKRILNAYNNIVEKHFQNGCCFVKELSTQTITELTNILSNLKSY